MADTDTPETSTPQDFKSIAQEIQGDVAPETPTEPSGPSSPVLKYLSAQGYDVANFESDDDVLPVLSERASKAIEYEAELEKLRKDNQIAQQTFADPEFQAWQKSRAAKPAEPEKVTEAPKFQPPTYDESWLERATQDPETGKFLPNTIADRDAADGLNRYVKENAAFQKRLATDLPGLLRDMGITDSLKAEVAKEFEPVQQELKQLKEWRDQLAAQEAEQRREAFLSQHSAHLFQLDEQGQVRLNPDGSPVLTQLGQWGDTLYRQLTDAKVPHEAAQQRMFEALAKFIPEQPPAEAVPSRTPPRDATTGKFLPADKAPAAPPPELKRQTFAQRANGKRLPAGAGHSGSHNGAGTPDDEDLESNDFAELAIGVMRKRGMTTG